MYIGLSYFSVSLYSLNLSICISSCLSYSTLTLFFFVDFSNKSSSKKNKKNCRLLPEDIVCKITQIYNIRRENTCDPALKLLNEEITSDIQKHKQNIWKEHLNAHWDHRHNTHTLWKTIHGLSNRAPPHILNTSIRSNNKIATTPPKHCELFHQTIHKHCQTHNTQNKQTH